MMDVSRLRKLQAELGVTFHNQRLLQQAFTHTSYVNEHHSAQHNERLEFLGDAVLELAVSQYLYKTYPDRPEGELTRLRASIVCEPSLCVFAERLNFGQSIWLGKGEEQTGGRTRPSLLADVFEAFIGALYLDQGLNAVEKFLQATVFNQLKVEQKNKLKDPKSTFQERTQQLDLGQVVYRLVEDRGPSHEKRFVSEVAVGDRTLGMGEGRSKKESEQQAATVALKQLGRG